jgi:hypothetical protein
MAEDRVLSGANDGRQYRVMAGSAFSWAYLLVEDRLGERFILDTDARALAPVTDIEAAGLLESRSYREWNGPQRWWTGNELSAIDGRQVASESPVVSPPPPDTTRIQ